METLQIYKIYKKEDEDSLTMKQRMIQAMLVNSVTETNNSVTVIPV